MLKEIIIFLAGIFCGFWLPWLVPNGLLNFWAGKEQDTNQTAVHDGATNKTTFFESQDEDFYKDDEEEKIAVLQKLLVDRTSVLCMVLTHPDRHYRTQHVKATWGRRCDVLLFFSTAEDASVPTVALPVSAAAEDYDWRVTEEAFKYVYDRHLKHDNPGRRVNWVLKVDDETYVVVENLRYLLSTHDFYEPVYFGRHTKTERTPPVLKTPDTDGVLDEKAGYVLSREALRKLVVEGLKGENRTCEEEGLLGDDSKMEKCMELLKVKSGNSEDSLGRERFFSVKPTDRFRQELTSKSWNLTNYFLDNGGRGLECCSDSAITFHQISSSYMHTLEYLLYHLHPYGTGHNRTFSLKIRTTKLQEVQLTPKQPSTVEL